MPLVVMLALEQVLGMQMMLQTVHISLLQPLVQVKL